MQFRSIYNSQNEISIQSQLRLVSKIDTLNQRISLDEKLLAECRNEIKNIENYILIWYNKTDRIIHGGLYDTNRNM